MIREGHIIVLTVSPEQLSCTYKVNTGVRMSYLIWVETVKTSSENQENLLIIKKIREVTIAL